MKCCRLPTLFKDLFQKTAAIHCHDARCATKQNYFLQQVSAKAGEKTFSYRGTIPWANLEHI